MAFSLLSALEGREYPEATEVLYLSPPLAYAVNELEKMTFKTSSPEELEKLEKKIKKLKADLEKTKVTVTLRGVPPKVFRSATQDDQAPKEAWDEWKNDTLIALSMVKAENHAGESETGPFTAEYVKSIRENTVGDEYSVLLGRAFQLSTAAGKILEADF